MLIPFGLFSFGSRTTFYIRIFQFYVGILKNRFLVGCFKQQLEMALHIHMSTHASRKVNPGIPPFSTRFLACALHKVSVT